MEKRLKKILELRDRSFKVWDYMRLKGYNGPVDEMQQIHEGLSQLLETSLGSFQPIYVTEDCIIAPGETKELKTDISKLGISSVDENNGLEFTNEGVVSTFGHLSFTFERDDENGNRILVTNNVPKEVEEKYDLCGYHYCNPETTQHFGPGIYKIGVGTMVGIAGIDTPSLDLDGNYRAEREEQDTQAVKAFDEGLQYIKEIR